MRPLSSQKQYLKSKRKYTRRCKTIDYNDDNIKVIHSKDNLFIDLKKCNTRKR